MCRLSRWKVIAIASLYHKQKVTSSTSKVETEICSLWFTVSSLKTCQLDASGVVRCKWKEQNRNPQPLLEVGSGYHHEPGGGGQKQKQERDIVCSGAETAYERQRCTPVEENGLIRGVMPGVSGSTDESLVVRRRSVHGDNAVHAQATVLWRTVITTNETAPWE